MKIKLSKSQWEMIGKKARWVEESQSVMPPESTIKKICPECHGNKHIKTKIKNLCTLEYTDHIIPCPTCNGKGYITKEDHDSYLHSMGVIPHPVNNFNKK